METHYLFLKSLLLSIIFTQEIKHTLVEILPYSYKLCPKIYVNLSRGRAIYLCLNPTEKIHLMENTLTRDICDLLHMISLQPIVRVLGFAINKIIIK